MPSGYEWELPAAFEDTGGGWTDTSNYDLGSSGGGSSIGSSVDLSGGGFNFEDDDWYVDTTGAGQAEVDTGYLSDIWGWVKSEQGTSVLGGAVSGLAKMWAMQKELEARKELARGSEGGPSAAELYDARVKKHNSSINQPMNMGMVNLKR